MNTQGKHINPKKGHNTIPLLIDEAAWFLIDYSSFYAYLSLFAEHQLLAFFYNYSNSLILAFIVMYTSNIVLYVFWGIY